MKKQRKLNGFIHFSDVTSNLSRARGMKRKADEQLLPENESISNKENEELLQIQNQTPEASDLLGQRNPLQSINLGEQKF